LAPNTVYFQNVHVFTGIAYFREVPILIKHSHV
jgi:hypothetical protein